LQATIWSHPSLPRARPAFKAAIGGKDLTEWLERGGFDEALGKYSEAYADQAERDFAAFKAAIRSGRLRTKPDRPSGFEFLV
jgi:hypothetical protein